MIGNDWMKRTCRLLCIARNIYPIEVWSHKGWCSKIYTDHPSIYFAAVMLPYPYSFNLHVTSIANGFVPWACFVSDYLDRTDVFPRTQQVYGNITIGHVPGTCPARKPTSILTKQQPNSNASRPKSRVIVLPIWRFKLEGIVLWPTAANKTISWLPCRRAWDTPAIMFMQTNLILKPRKDIRMLQ